VSSTEGVVYLARDIETGSGWLDAEGYRFYVGEFC
jgi:hypothetical protein